MSKKYVPSGYQIINLLPKDYGTDDEILDSDSDDAKILNQIREECFRTKQLPSKPILLTVMLNGYVYGGFGDCTLADDLSSISINLCNYESIVSIILSLENEGRTTTITILSIQ